MYNAVTHNATGSVRKYGYCDFTGDYDTETESQITLVEGSVPPAGVAVYYCKVVAGVFTEMTNEEKAAVDAAGLSDIPPSSELTEFVNENARVTDEASGVTGPFELMQLMLLRKEFYNDTDSPLYTEGFTPVLGAGGWAEDHANRIANCENIHAKTGWHEQQVRAGRYLKPNELLIYYGWLNSLNSATNGWSNEKVAQDLARYRIIVVGDGIQDPSHGDYANTSVIIPRVKALNPNALIFGYVATTAAIGTFQTKVDQWDTLGVHGIFMDMAGYDYGTNRADFNTRVDYVHGKATANLCFPNAWNLDHILGTENDASYPNATYNPSAVASKLASNDWALLESFPINTDSFTGTGGYEAKADWAARGVKAIGLRYAYGINLAACGIVNSSNPNGNALYQFGLVSAMMFSLEAFGVSDTSYGSGSAAAPWWSRPPVDGIGEIWSMSPSVQVDASDADVYWRFVEFGKLKLDFSSEAYLSEIIFSQTTKDISYDRKEGTTQFESWHTSPSTGTAQTTGAIVANRLYAMPFVVPKRVWIDGLAFNVTTAGTGNARIGLYESDGRGYAGKLIADSGNISIASTGVKTYLPSGGILLTPGLKFLAIVSNGTPTLRCHAVGGLIVVLGSPAALGTASILGFYAAHTFAALPAAFPALGAVMTAAPLPALSVRFPAW